MLERRVAIAAFIFLMAITGVVGLSVKLFGIGLPTCLNDVRPFTEGSIVEQSPNHYEVHYLARMWAFEPREMTMKPGSTADFYVATADVTHGVNIIGTNFNLMAVPGTVNYGRVKFDKPGDYLVVCNEYCGVAHHNMAGVIHVTATATAAPVAGNGRDLLEKEGCLACHSIDGTTGVAPTFKGLYMSTRTLANGQTVTADEQYLRESIQHPDAKVVKGFDAMPPVPVPDAEVQAMIDAIKGMK